MRCSCCCIRSRDHTYRALCRLSSTLMATEGWVADARTGSATSPNSSRPAIVSTADFGDASVPPAAMVKLYETSLRNSLLEQSDNISE